MPCPRGRQLIEISRFSYFPIIFQLSGRACSYRIQVTVNFAKPKIGGPSKMTFGTSNLLLFFLADGYLIIKSVLDSTHPWLHNGLRKIRKN